MDVVPVGCPIIGWAAEFACFHDPSKRLEGSFGDRPNLECARGRKCHGKFVVLHG
jgi:hypothetical protein